MPVSEAEYRKLLEREGGRKAGPQTSRDDAVRRANIAAGYGNSTALHKPAGSTSPFKLSGGSGGGRRTSGGQGGQGGQGGGKSGGGKVAPNPNANMTTPTSAPGFLDPGNMTTPTSAENPMLSPTSQPGFMPWPLTPGPTTQPQVSRGPTTEGGGFSPMRDPSLMWPGATAGAAVPDFPPDLAVSPLHERWPGATGMPPVRIPANGRNPPREPVFGFNRGGFKNEPQDPNEPWWKAMFRG